MSDNPKVFISYSHKDNDYEQKILSFANKLRSEGIDANVDLYEEAPSEGWQRWMENQINSSDYVVIINSESYYNKFYKNQGKGISWEVHIIYQLLYDLGGNNTKFIPIVFEEKDIQYILTPLKSYTFYNIGNNDEYDALYWRLRGIPKIEKPPLGAFRALPKKEQKTMFYSTPIDIEKWDQAGWKGIVYFFSSKVPIMGLLFQNYEMGREIFREWKTKANNGFADEFLSLTYIVPPFPKGCWIYGEPDSNNGNGYIVHIGANIDSVYSRAHDSGVKDNEILISTVSRFRWMPELNGNDNRICLQNMTNSGKEYYIVPVGLRSWSNSANQFSESNILIDFSDMVMMKKLVFKRGIDIDNNDPTIVVLSKPK
ncbi:MAG: toll/interleukin-1 receptor domain-containing protein [Clostridiales bacterium]|nr:toll/interleukin-1 receptor domain-containing protein [Clostridiales bacterium]